MILDDFFQEKELEQPDSTSDEVEDIQFEEVLDIDTDDIQKKRVDP